MLNVRLPYASCYAVGWAPLLVLLALPIVRFPDVDALAVAGVVALVAFGYVGVRLAQPSSASAVGPVQAPSALYARATVLFSLATMAGCLLVLREQAGFLGDLSFDNLQERYIALVEASLEGSASSSALSSLGNLLRSFFFVAISSWVAYTTTAASRWSKLILGMLVVGALLLNFQVMVSRLQLVFFIICAVLAAIATRHPLLRHKTVLATSGALLFLFLSVTMAQRFDAKFGDVAGAADYIAEFFGVEMLPLGRSLVEDAGLAVFALGIYITQGVPELIRLIAYNPSPYSFGTHSLFLVLSPLMRLAGATLEPLPPMSNQGFWWGLLGDLYIDFGWLFPLVYLAVLPLLVRVAVRWGSGPVYGFSLRVLTAGLLAIVPYTGIFNTYAVSYFGLVLLAIKESSALARETAPRPSADPTLTQLHQTP